MQNFKIISGLQKHKVPTFILLLLCICAALLYLFLLRFLSLQSVLSHRGIQLEFTSW